MLRNWIRKMESLAIKAFEESIQNVSVSGGKISLVGNGKKAVVTSTWSQRNVDRKVLMNNQLVQLVDLDSSEVTTTHATENSSELLSSYSPSFAFRCVLRSLPPSDNNPKKKQHLEIWQNNSMKKLYDLTALDVHGDVYTDREFGCLEWSPCETKILFTAEKKKKKSGPFLPTPVKPSEDTSYGTEYELVEEWGEALVGKSLSVLVVCDTKTNKVSVASPDMTLSLGSAQWASDSSIVCVGWETAPYRLGKVFCSNRPSSLLHITSVDDFVTLRKGFSILSPKFSPDSTKLIWLEREASGPHNSCMRLMKMDWATKKISTVVDIVDHSQPIANNGTFYGIYSLDLGNCWLNDNSTIIISCIQRASTRLYAINVDTGAITDISDCSSTEESFSYGVLDVCQDIVLAWKSSLLHTPSLMIGRYSKIKCDVEWTTLVDMKEIAPNHLVDVIRHDSVINPEVAKSFSAIYYGPKSGDNVPLIVFPHGGPHSTSTNTYSMLVTFFGKMNFAVLFVNFRGSTGAGDASVKSLLGNVGTNDVSDCHQATVHVLDKYSKVLSKDKVFLFGGSHGGFLVLHLNGQYPGFFSSTVALNPVTDLTGLSPSDLGDWAMVESGFSFNPLTYSVKDPDEKQYKLMKSMSPISHVDNVISPTLLLLGKNDLRVPPSQGISYYHALKARGLPAKVLMYEDNHGLPKTPHEVDFAINLVLWFLKELETEVDCAK